MSDAYLESAEGIAITRQRALEELQAHGIEAPAEFFADLGECDIYRARDVLTWLGY
ncbi:hypothetical protein [Pantoea piersonii]|uniref:hypothetical protein n=1 Tax=Pantoea TaxID=53335 RepID=UPI0028AECCBA|nr:hypothetical protein [Pantoea piersonii]